MCKAFTKGFALLLKIFKRSLLLLCNLMFFALFFCGLPVAARCVISVAGTSLTTGFVIITERDGGTYSGCGGDKAGNQKRDGHRGTP